LSSSSFDAPSPRRHELPPSLAPAPAPFLRPGPEDVVVVVAVVVVVVAAAAPPSSQSS
jgi:hypothetical protein